LAINWPKQSNILLSDKDKNASSFADTKFFTNL
jgi:dTDP-4-dehydrorhamnose 3,5-epimerase-like enzyme